MKKRAGSKDFDQATGVGLSLEEWLQRLADSEGGDGPRLFIDYQFPTEAHAEEYLATVHARSEDEVTDLLCRFLFGSCSFPQVDALRLEFLRARVHGPERFTDSPIPFTPLDRTLRLESTRRLLAHVGSEGRQPSWEGIRWVVDLLPHFPRDAIDAVHAYVLAHGQLLPDGRLQGLSDATAVIRARFVQASATDASSALASLTPREFERLAQKLFEEMGYDSTLTKATRDGGRDVICERNTTGGREKVLVECKLYDKTAVGLDDVMKLLGVVTREPACRGVILTTGHVTKPAMTADPRVEVVARDDLIRLLGDTLGSKWPLHVEALVGARSRVSTTGESEP